MFVVTNIYQLHSSLHISCLEKATANQQLPTYSTLKILCLYFDTLIIGHNFLQYIKYTKLINIAKRIANIYVYIDCLTKNNTKIHQQQNKKQTKSPCHNYQGMDRYVTVNHDHL